jgi:hypothetical protein
VTLRLDTLLVAADGTDRVRLTGARGEPPPPTVKVSLNTLGGFRNQVEFVLTGLDVEAKAALVREQLDVVGAEWTLVRTDDPDAPTEERASALLRCVVRSPDRARVGRAFSNSAVELALASYPGFHLTAPPGEASPYGVFTAGYVDPKAVEHTAVLPDGTRVPIDPPASTLDLADLDEPPLPPWRSARTRSVPLGTVVGARSGDKGGSANVGLWARNPDAWPWLANTLTVDRLRRLLPEARDLPITRHVLPNLHAVNFVIDALLGLGVAYHARFDPQAKALGEWLRSRHMDVPEELL